MGFTSPLARENMGNSRKLKELGSSTLSVSVGVSYALWLEASPSLCAMYICLHCISGIKIPTQFDYPNPEGHKCPSNLRCKSGKIRI